MLIDELNDLFITELAYPIEETAYVDEKCSLAVKHQGKLFILVGSSHTGRLADCLDDFGLNVIDLTVPGWEKCSKDGGSAV
jgi:hypothetical protein